MSRGDALYQSYKNYPYTVPLGPRWDRLNHRLDPLEHRLDPLHHQLDQLDHRLDQLDWLDQWINQLNSKLDRLEIISVGTLHSFHLDIYFLCCA